MGNVSAPGLLGAHAVGDRVRRVDAHRVASRQALLPVVRRLRLHADHLDVRQQSGGCHRAARQQPAATDRHQQPIERLDLLDELERGGALAGHDQRVVVGRHEGRPAFVRQTARDGLAVFGQAVVAHDLGAVALGGGQLQRRRVGWHDHRGPNAELARGQRHALGVIA